MSLWQWFSCNQSTLLSSLFYLNFCIFYFFFLFIYSCDSYMLLLFYLYAKSFYLIFYLFTLHLISIYPFSFVLSMIPLLLFFCFLALVDFFCSYQFTLPSTKLRFIQLLFIFHYPIYQIYHQPNFYKCFLFISRHQREISCQVCCRNLPIACWPMVSWQNGKNDKDLIIQSRIQRRTVYLGYHKSIL